MNTSFLSLLGKGFATAASPYNLGAALLGSVLGLIVGAMPGLGSLTGVALLLPLTYNFNPTTAIIMLAGIYYANMYGGAYSAILLNIPGDNSAVMTALDGYPMAKKGKAGKALMSANLASCIGGTIGMVILTCVGPMMATFGLKFGPAEMTALLLAAMSSLGWLVGENPLKGYVSAAVGMLLATVGIDNVNGLARYDFGILELLGGISFIPLVIGFFGFSQLLTMMNERHNAPAKSAQESLRLKDSMLSKEELRDLVGPACRSGILGTLIGIMPGAGGSIGSFLGYVMEKKIGRHKEQMGEGVIEGIAASEAGNNAAVAGAMAPLLSLGIPGSGTTAVLLGGLIMWGLTPGPLLFTQNSEFAWGLIASLYIANILTLMIGTAIIPFLTKLAKVPIRLLIPIISVICFVGAYSSTNSMYGVIIMLIAGAAGFIFRLAGYPAAPVLLAFVLSSTLELNMRRAFAISKGSPLIFVQKPISLFFLIFIALTLIIPELKKRVKNKS